MAYIEPDKLEDAREDNEARPKFNEKELLEEALGNFETDYSDQSDEIDKAKADVEFIDMDPWEGEKRDPNIPSLNLPQLPQFVHRIVNSFRSNVQEAKILPVDNHADIETAAALQGYWRHVEQRSRAKMVYSHALMQAVKSGMGWMRVFYDYINEESFDMDLTIERVVNRFNVLPGPAMRQDFSDMTRFYVTELISEEMFSHQYPAAADTFALKQNAEYANWFSAGGISVRQYWRMNETDDELWLLSNGMKIFKSVLPEKDLNARKLFVLKRRKVKRPEWQWFKIAAGDVLKSRIWLGRHPPYVPILGNEKVLPDGRILYTGIPREGKDGQILYNYAASVEAQILQRHSKRRVIHAVGQLEGLAHIWADEDADDLPYNPISIDGVVVAAPRYEELPIVPTGLVNLKNSARSDIMAALGVYQDSLGAPSNAQSGIAIRRRQAEGRESYFHYLDNADIGIEALCRAGIDLARKTITKETIRRTLDEEGKQTFVTFNKKITDPAGDHVLFDLSVGEFDIRLSSGPSFVNQQQETLELILGIGEKIPGAAVVGPDILVSLAAGHRQELKDLAARLRLTIDPRFLAATDTKNAEQAISVLQNAMQSEMAKSKTLAEAVDALTQELIKAKDINLIENAKIEKDKYVADLKSKTDLQLEEMKLGLVGKDEIEAEIEKLNQELYQADASLEQRGIAAAQTPPGADEMMSMLSGMGGPGAQGVPGAPAEGMEPPGEEVIEDVEEPQPPEASPELPVEEEVPEEPPPAPEA
jgi:hypothetical protein